MTTIERVQERVAEDIAVTIVDTDVHPLPVSGDVLKAYAPPEWKNRTTLADRKCRLAHVVLL